MSKKVNSNSLFRKSKYITNVGYLNTKISPRLITNIQKWILTGINPYHSD